jgi:hypothetical protein
MKDAAALPLLPFAGSLRRKRFASALSIVMSEKKRAREIIIPVTSLRKHVVCNGRAAAVADHLYDQVNPPWWKLTFDWLVEWIRENWDVIFKVLLTLLSLLVAI